MGQIKQLILLHQQGKGRKTIARILGMSKNTVKVYLEKLSALTTHQDGKGYTLEELLKMDYPVLEANPPWSGFIPGIQLIRMIVLRISRPGWIIILKS